MIGDSSGFWIMYSIVAVAYCAMSVYLVKVLWVQVELVCGVATLLLFFMVTRTWKIPTALIANIAKGNFVHFIPVSAERGGWVVAIIQILSPLNFAIASGWLAFYYPLPTAWYHCHFLWLDHFWHMHFCMLLWSSGDHMYAYFLGSRLLKKKKKRKEK